METAIQDIITRRLETGLADLLLAMYHAGYCTGAHLPLDLPTEDGAADLVLLVEARHRVEVRELRGPHLLADGLPGCLLTQPQQADPVRLRAYAERVLALGEHNA